MVKNHMRAFAGLSIFTLSLGLAVTANASTPVDESRNGVCVTAKFSSDQSIESKKCIYFEDDGKSEEVETPNPEPTPPTEENKEDPPVIESTGFMISSWDTSTDDNCKTINLPITGASNLTIDWGDGTKDRGLGDNPSHEYNVESTNQVIAISGEFDNWGNNTDNMSGTWEDSNCITEVKKWDDTNTTDLTAAFVNANKLTHVEEIPSTTTNMTAAFKGIKTNPTFGDLDTSNVTNMNYLFYGSTTFNRPFNFDTSNAVELRNMFYGSQAFNQPINMDIPKAKNISGMFRNTPNFDSPVIFTNSQNVEIVDQLFYGTPSIFNQPFSMDTSGVKSMREMFRNNDKFNSPINFTSTANVEDMSFMFYGMDIFDQPLNFDTSNVINMTEMFADTKMFNQPLNFNTKNVENMRQTFALSKKFNQDLSSWNVDKVTNHEKFDLYAESYTKAKPNFK